MTDGDEVLMFTLRYKVYDYLTAFRIAFASSLSKHDIIKQI